MSERYQIHRGKLSNGSVNYGVQDTMPPLGSDGRIRDYENEAAAKEHAARLNAAFAMELRARAPRALEWVWNGRCYWWDIPRKTGGAYYG